MFSLIPSSTLVSNKYIFNRIKLWYQMFGTRRTSSFSMVLDQELTKLYRASFDLPQYTLTKHGSLRTTNKNISLINMCGLGYLGICENPLVTEAAIEALHKYGCRVTSSPSMSGYTEIHEELEEKIANFHSRPSALLHGSCYQANIGLFVSILDKQDIIVCDNLNHISIRQGVELSRAQRFVYRNRDMQELEYILQNKRNQGRLCMVATDGVFSMEGTIAPLREICDICEKYEAVVFVDDAHATGVLGETGRGSDQHCDSLGRPQIINSSITKAIGIGGGYTTGEEKLIQLLRASSYSYAYSATLSPVVAAIASASLDVFAQHGHDLLSTLRANVLKFRQMMKSAGFVVMGEPGVPICPVVVGKESLAKKVALRLLDMNILTFPACFPVVPKGKARIRIIISALHTHEDIETTVNAFVQVAKEFDLPHTDGPTI